MKDFLRLLWLFKGSWRWVLAGVGLTALVILANVGLLALSGWFIASMALAGLGLLHLEYFMPAASIRGLAIIRTGGRYLERLITHEATFRFLAQLRVWFYEHLEPLAPARLQYYRGGDLLSRIRADIDSLDNVYLRVLVPTASAVITVLLMVLFLAWFSPHVALADFAGLAARRCGGAADGAAPGRANPARRRLRCAGHCAPTSPMRSAVSASCWSIRRWRPNWPRSTAAARP